MTKHNTRIITLNVLTIPWHWYRPIDFIVKLSYEYIYKKYGVVIDGVCENWHQLTMIILGWTYVKTKKKKKLHWHFISFLTTSILFQYQMSKLTRTCKSRHVTYDRAFRQWQWLRISINLQVQLWSTTDELTTSQLDRSDEWWAIMGVTQ